MTEQPLFTSLDSSKLQAEIVDLLCRTARDKGRVEITNCAGGTCVMISKDELDALERALEILSDTDAGRAMHQAVKRFVKVTEGQVPPTARV